MAKSSLTSENFTKNGQMSSKRELLAPVQMTQCMRLILLARVLRRAADFIWLKKSMTSQPKATKTSSTTRNNTDFQKRGGS